MDRIGCSETVALILTVLRSEPEVIVIVPFVLPILSELISLTVTVPPVFPMFTELLPLTVNAALFDVTIISLLREVPVTVKFCEG